MKRKGRKWVKAVDFLAWRVGRIRTVAIMEGMQVPMGSLVTRVMLHGFSSETQMQLRDETVEL